MKTPAAVSSSTPPVLLGVGTVRHHRTRPRAHGFAYGTYFVMLALRRWQREPGGALPRGRFGLVSFDDRDHGDGRADCLQWIESVLAAEGITDATGEIWLHCFPRVLGYAFKPVSFWYCHREDGSLAAILVEVNNTFGERHCYLLAGADLAYGRELTARKVFHVSPFCRTEGDYRFRFMRTPEREQAGRLNPARTVVRIEHHDAEGLLIATSVAGELAPVTTAGLRAAFFGQPLMTLGVVARIHWQAWKLWRKRVPFFRKPTPPEQFVTR